MARTINLWWHNNDGISNFGDELGPYLVEKITGKTVRFQKTSRMPWPKTHMVIGSILAAAKRNCIIWGAGLIDRKTKVGPAIFYAVRGPLTREILIKQGHKVPEVYGDPAILLPRFLKPKVISNAEIGIIPHIVDYEMVKVKVDDRIKVIDLTKDIEEVVKDICSCSFTFSSSLHGIIVSHAYGIPSRWVKFSDKLYGDGIKFNDYYHSVNINGARPLLINEHSADYDYFKSHLTEKETLPQIDLVSLGDELMANCPFKT
ncbi:MAG: polysaccharide pyruvyl transferase family protein [Fulvivirga sp.]